MTKPFLIVFEGIDNSGKTSISEEVHRIVHEDAEAVARHRENNGDEKVAQDPSSHWAWYKEPTFSTEEADRLNDPATNMDQNEREVLFLESRLRQQSKYKASSVVLDRYLWTGMAYASMFSPDCYEFCTSLYNGENDIFVVPDLTIFVDTPVSVCHERDPEVSVERLTGIRDAYMGAKKFVKGPVETITGEGSLEDNVQCVLDIIKERLFGEGSERAKCALEFPSRDNELNGQADVLVAGKEEG